ncbi:Hypothetical protein CINCED_3A007783 [Cinara cedri]|uniref:Uncharacterized protein n=1 Tax=Cinara cedri TaxID=506608 RepID=A0A5E4MUM6_9HEMI|nr:Hypothetical protein CINCED_3A007783 [Cinara cedri]
MDILDAETSKILLPEDDERCGSALVSAGRKKKTNKERDPLSTNREVPNVIAK